MSTDRIMVPVESVVINRERFREAEVKHVEELSVSLLKHGQLQPIIIEPNGNLLAGLHRLTAARELGWLTIWADVQAELDEEQAREIELEENIRRRQMTWQESAKALAELDRIRKTKDPNWGQTQTAIVSGVQQRDVSNAIKITKMMDLFPELEKAKSLNQALSWAEQKASNVTRVLDVQAKPEEFKAISDRIHLGDSVEYIKSIPSDHVDLILTDPPFGIDLGERKANTDGSLTAYQDDADAYRRLLSMAPDLYRVLKPDGFLVWFFGMSWYSEVKETFRAAGFTVDELPIMWNRSGGRCHTNRPDRYFGRGYDVAIHAFKGDNPQIIKRGLSNVITIDPIEADERETLVERPVELYEHLIKALTVPGELVADFFVGSGACPAAAARTGRNYLGSELSPERRAVALNKIKAYTPEK